MTVSTAACDRDHKTGDSAGSLNAVILITALRTGRQEDVSVSQLVYR